MSTIPSQIFSRFSTVANWRRLPKTSGQTACVAAGLEGGDFRPWVGERGRRVSSKGASANWRLLHSSTPARLVPKMSWNFRPATSLRTPAYITCSRSLSRRETAFVVAVTGSTNATKGLYLKFLGASCSRGGLSYLQPERVRGRPQLALLGYLRRSFFCGLPHRLGWSLRVPSSEHSGTSGECTRKRRRGWSCACLGQSKRCLRRRRRPWR